MIGKVIEFLLSVVTAGKPETLDAAVLEVSARISSLNAGKRRLYTRLDELRSGAPSLRRRRPRTPQLTLQRAVTFYSIEEAAPAEAGRHRHSA